MRLNPRVLLSYPHSIAVLARVFRFGDAQNVWPLSGADIAGRNSRTFRRVVTDMTNNIRVGVQLWPGGAPDYRTWREAVLHAEELGADLIFGYDHFHAPAVAGFVDAKPVLAEVQPDVNNFEGWTALA